MCVLPTNLGQAAEICYEDVGCFNDLGCHADAFPPLTPAEVNTRFFLFTQSNLIVSQELIVDDNAGLLASNFDPFKKTKFSVHGWNSDSGSSSERERRDAFLEVVRNSILVWGLINGDLYITPLSYLHVKPSQLSHAKRFSRNRQVVDPVTAM